jgi:hypothetical protein
MTPYFSYVPPLGIRTRTAAPRSTPRRTRTAGRTAPARAACSICAVAADTYVNTAGMDRGRERVSSPHICAHIPHFSLRATASRTHTDLSSRCATAWLAKTFLATRKKKMHVFHISHRPTHICVYAQQCFSVGYHTWTRCRTRFCVSTGYSIWQSTQWEEECHGGSWPSI